LEILRSFAADMCEGTNNERTKRLLVNFNPEGALHSQMQKQSSMREKFSRFSKFVFFIGDLR
jgi:hypothetical protein